MKPRKPGTPKPKKPMRPAHKLPRSVRRLFPKVTDAVDATKPISVTVTPRDCTGATESDPTACAMAQAAKREHEADGCIIGLSYSYIIKGPTAVRYKTPESVAREIISFDRHGDFATGEYAFRPASPGSRLGMPHKGSGSGSHGPTRVVHRASARVRVLERGATW